ncbi:MAG: ribosomal protein S18-alanine N-acetyltransferase [Elusimicrobiota bacterium]|jgi:ribosomal-protein-alanine N-acetyltransferase
MVEIKRFDGSWLESVAALENRAGDVRWSRAQFEKELSLPMSRFFVMTQDHALLGYGGYWKVGLEAQIINLVIEPKDRRQGSGERLLRFLLEQARSEACQRCSLDVRASNHAALSLYGKVGFQKVGQRPRFYEAPMEDAVLMEKVL